MLPMEFGADNNDFGILTRQAPTATVGLNSDERGEETLRASDLVVLIEEAW